MNRRQAIGCFVTTVIGASAGCIESIAEDKNEQLLCEVSIINKLTEPVQIEVQISQDGDFQTEKELPPPQDDNDGEVYTVPPTDLPDKTGQYLIQVDIVGNGWEKQGKYQTGGENSSNGTIMWVLSEPVGEGQDPTLQLLTGQESSEC